MLHLYKSLFRDVYNVLTEYAPREYYQGYTAEVSERLTAIINKYSDHRLARAMALAVYCELTFKADDNYSFELINKQEMKNDE